MTELGPSPLAAGEHNLSVAQARAAILLALSPLEGAPQTTPLAQALGRVLAADVISPLDVPAHDNSAMDGYAFDGAVLSPKLARSGRIELQAVGSVMAGQALAHAVGQGQCLRIMTGAVLPPGQDTVVPLELCSIDGEHISFDAMAVRRGDNRRMRGEDLTLGRPALLAGHVLRPADLGLLASLGLSEVSLHRRLRVALFSSGDEVVAPGQPLPPGSIYDSNRASLGAALRRLGAEVIDLGVVRDDPAELRAVLQQAAASADAIITSGGVSAGDADHTRSVLAELGQVGFWKVAMRPGRPFAFGALQAGERKAWLFALPGNPVAALVTFYVLARDGLLQLAGARPQALPLLRVRSVAAIRKRPGRTEYQRATVAQGDDGQWQVTLFGSQGAGILRSMSESNALVVLHHEQGSVAAGEMVDVWPFDGLV